MPDLALRVDDLHVTYKVYEDQRPTLRRRVANGFRPQRSREVRAVRGLSFDLYRGDALGVIGHNGSGKSTMLRALAGLLPPTDGAVYATDVPVLLGVQAALQQELSGRRNILLGATALGMTKREVERRTDEIVQFAGLEEFIDLPLRAYSSGMVARLNFAIATSVLPEILLIDEALAVGDAEFQQRSRVRLEHMLERAGTVVLVSHSMSHVRELCHRVLWLERGVMRALGPTDEVIDAYEAEVAARA